MVIFQTPEGNPGYNQFETLEEAVAFVEVLRNEQSVETARMFALEEVKFELKPYYKVELDPPMLGTGPGYEALPSYEAPASYESVSFEAPAAYEPPAGYEPPTSYEPAPAYSAPYEAAPSYADQVAETESAGVGSAPPPTFMAPAYTPEEAPTGRRGLFGR